MDVSHTLDIRDGFEPEFPGSSEPELWKFRAELSRAGALQFPSWNRADNTDNMFRISSYKALPWLTFDKFFENPNPHFITRLLGVRIWSQLWIMYTYLHKWMQEFSFYIITSILPIFEPTFFISELKGKGHEPSRAENSSARATAWASSARAHHY